jgi:transposase
MNIHKNARLTPLRREEMARSVVEGRLSKAQAARTYGVSAKVVTRWVDRFRAEGRAGMADRSSRPKVMPGLTGQAVADLIVVLRRQRWTGKHISREVGVSPATVSRVLRRAGLSRLKDLEPAEPVRRYEREHPGEMIHIDIKGTVRNFVREAMMMRRRIIAWQSRKTYWTGCSPAATRTRYFRVTVCSTI